MTTTARLTATMSTAALVATLGTSFTSASPALAGAPAAAAATSVSIRASASTALVGERIYVDGHLKPGDGADRSGRTVVLQRRVGEGSWTSLGSDTTSGSGHFVLTDRPRSSASYRVVVRGGADDGDRSTTTAVKVVSSGSRKLVDRQKQIAHFLGEQVGGPTARGAYVSQRYSTGVLVKVNRRAGARVWAVTGRMYSQWTARGGLDGRLRHPVTDVLCGLLENSCIQRFAGGTLYYNGAKKKTFVYYGDAGRWTEVAAAEWSQLNYKEPSWRASKFNDWIGADNAWCGIFQAWGFEASGNAGLIPKKTTFSATWKAARSTMKIVRSPRPGDLAFMAFDGGGTPTHVAFVRKANTKTIVTIEGNTTSGTGDATRGVWTRTRDKKFVVFYARPAY